MTWNAMMFGHSVDEMVRMLGALQRIADGSVLTPPPQIAKAAMTADAPPNWFHQAGPDR